MGRQSPYNMPTEMDKNELSKCRNVSFKISVGAIPKEGSVGPARQSFFWYGNDKDHKRLVHRHFSVVVRLFDNMGCQSPYNTPAGMSESYNYKSCILSNRSSRCYGGGG